MTYLSHTNAPDVLGYSKSETSFGMTQGLFTIGRAGLKNKRRRTHDTRSIEVGA